MPKKPKTTLPAFTPVPREKDRSNGWKPEVQRAFIEALAETGSVRAACRRVGRADHGAYLLRRHPEGASFRAAWDAALDLGIRRIEDAAMDRALYGTEVIHLYHGEVTRTERKYNERLVMFMLRNRAPHRFAAGGGAKGLNAVGQMDMKRLKKQWRKEWERERFEQDREEQDETLESIDAFLDTMRHNHLANMSPGQRALQIAAQAQERADKAAGWTPGMAYREFAEEAARLRPQFEAEVEAQWPPLEPWAWDEPDPLDDPDLPALPPPGYKRKEEPKEQPDPGPKVRTLKDDGW